MRRGVCPVEQLIVGEGPRAYRLALSLTRDHEESQELVQAAAYQLLRCRHRYDSMRNGGAWFKTVVRNLFIDSRRSAARRLKISLDRPVPGSGEVLGESLPSSGLDAEALLERDEEKRAIRRVLGRLGRRHREVLKLCDLQELSYREAAMVLAVKEGTLRSQLHRARRSFRALWIKEMKSSHA